jgi:uncharacterized membrane protein (UPF0136 family)
MSSRKPLRQRSLWWSAVSIVLMVVGAFGPWVDVAGIATIKGTEGGRDGWLVVGAAVAAAVALSLYARYRRWWILVVPILAGIAGVVTTAVDINDLNDERIFGDFQVSAGWGISLAFLASASLVAASTVLLVARWRGRRAPVSVPTGA